MNIRILIGIFSFVAVVLGIGFAASYFAYQPAAAGQEADSLLKKGAVAKRAEPVSHEEKREKDQLKVLSDSLLQDIQAERRLRLNMLGQLQTHKALLSQLQTYAGEIEGRLKVLDDITDDEFQEDVQLQASLFSGKKPDIVAKHLEEFRASRVGAILAKMKEKEASAVLDIWAKQKNPKVSAFYRETMAAYLNNKRRDLHPELFEGASADSVAEVTVP